MSESNTLKSKSESKSRSKWTQVRGLEKQNLSNPVLPGRPKPLTDCLLESLPKSMHSFSVAAINRGRLHSH